MSTYTVGSLVRVKGVFMTGSALVDPSTVSFSMHAPQTGTITVYHYPTDAQLVREGLGTYHVNINVNEPGDWHYQFYSTGTGQALKEGSFVVVEVSYPSTGYTPTPRVGAIQSPLGTALTARTYLGFDGTLLAATDDSANDRINVTAPGLASIAYVTSHVIPLSSATPQALGTAAAGTATSSSRADHVHASELGNATPLALGTAAAGTASSASRVDHVHATEIPSQTGNSGKFISTNGSAISWQTAIPSQTGNSGKFLTTNGSAASWAVSGSLGFFDIRDSFGGAGAVGDGITDDGPAIQRAINAAIAVGGGTVYIPPTANSWKVGTGIISSDITVTYLRILGSGAAGPIKCATGPTADVFNLLISNSNFIGYYEQLTFVTNDPGTYLGTQDCRDVVYGGSDGGQWNYLDLEYYGVYAKGSFVHCGPNINTVRNVKAGGGFCYDGSSFQPAVFLDHVITTDVDNVDIQSSGTFRGVLYTGGEVLCSVALSPENNTGIGGQDVSRVRIRRVVSTNRTLYCIVIQVGLVGPHTQGSESTTAHIGGSVLIEDFQSGSPVSIFIDGCRDVEISHGHIAPGSTETWLISNVDHLRIRDIQNEGTGMAINLASTVLHAEIEDTALTAISQSPCGIKLADALSTTAFITTKGIRARVRQAQAAIVANTLVKAGATDGFIDQLATGDDARLAVGVAFDTATTNDFVRSLEQTGQIVSIKTDGATTISPGDIFTSSGISAGRIKKTTSVGASTVGNGMKTVAATADLMVDVMFHKSQY